MTNQPQTAIYTINGSYHQGDYIEVVVKAVKSWMPDPSGKYRGYIRNIYTNAFELMIGDSGYIIQHELVGSMKLLTVKEINMLERKIQ